MSHEGSISAYTIWKENQNGKSKFGYKKALCALRLIKKYFNKNEMQTMLDSNYYSILYYNSVIWLTPELNTNVKQDSSYRNKESLLRVSNFYKQAFVCSMYKQI